MKTKTTYKGEIKMNEKEAKKAFSMAQYMLLAEVELTGWDSDTVDLKTSDSYIIAMLSDYDADELEKERIKRLESGRLPEAYEFSFSYKEAAEAIIEYCEVAGYIVDGEMI